MELKVTERDMQFPGIIVFNNTHIYDCDRCGSVVYFYFDKQLTFALGHRNMYLGEGGKFKPVPRCPRCNAELAHMVKAIDLLGRR
jgi:hypothetical protein